MTGKKSKGGDMTTKKDHTKEKGNLTGAPFVSKVGGKRKKIEKHYGDSVGGQAT